MKHIFALALAISTSAVYARPATCLPKQFAGSGTMAIFKSNSKGDLAAYYCPGEAYPTMFVCLKATCSLVASKRAFATLISNPTLAGMNAAIAPYTRDPLRDPELKQAWMPHADEIAALAK